RSYSKDGIKLSEHDFSVFKNENIHDLMERLKINSVIISEVYSKDIDFVTKIRRSAKNVFILPDSSSLFSYYSYLFSTIYSDTLVLSIKNNLKEPFNIITKRLFDVAFCILLLPLILPTMFIIAILIKVDSKGPAIFKQRRMGRGGKAIMIYKFRTMYMNSDEILKDYLMNNPHAREEWELFRKLKKGDPRITRIGKFLRRTSLDELPQIFNVLKGEMSLVGPRPVSEEEIEKYYREFSDFYYEVQPGITGLWQVSGRNETDFPRRVFLDSIYALNWSLWLDIVILIKTIKSVVKGEGAY
ncbi:MAG: exopolysaccharide biosynthesis polyprenyl glycosylphosphotransferase, partial [Candidatus Aenigmatarchaeota archaeon]